MKYLGINLPKEIKDLYSEDTDERNYSRYKQMKRYTVFLDWKNQYCENNHISQSTLQIQCNFYQNTKDIFQRITTKVIFKFLWKHKRHQITKAILRKKRNHTP